VYVEGRCRHRSLRWGLQRGYASELGTASAARRVRNQSPLLAEIRAWLLAFPPERPAP
jgi:hypothetical protein